MSNFQAGYMEMKSNYLWLLDAGHGGMKNGVYTTAPAKMYTHPDPDGFTACEGIINRAVAKLLWLELVNLNIDFKLIYDEADDDSLDVRVERVNSICSKEKRICIFVSIHSNAGKGLGNEIFVYTIASERSKKVANIWCETYMKLLPDFTFRKHSHDQLFKQANFQVLRETKCPAILVENLFFDNRKEAEYLLSEKGQRDIACCILQCIQNVEYLKPI